MDSQAYNDIFMNFKKTDAEAERLDRVARQMKQLAEDQLAGIIQTVDNNWRAEASVDYIKKCEQLRHYIEETAKDIKKAADAVRGIAQATQEAEMKALEIIETASGVEA